ncbi:MAG: cell division protein ZipA [Pseudomonadota bacterium]
MDQYWLTIIIVLLLIAIVIDGIRRMRNARKNSIKMALRPVDRSHLADDSDDYGSEFPNGGARASDRQIDPERIQQVRKKYDFGTDIPAWREKVADTLANMRSSGQGDSAGAKAMRIEPSLESSADPDPLLDKTSSGAKIPVPEQPNAVEANAADSEPDHSQQQKPSDDPVAEPVQASLNLEDAVPMLMDSVDESEMPENARIRLQTPSPQQPIHPIATHVRSSSHIDAEDNDDELALETHSANKPRYESKYIDHKAGIRPKTPQDVLVMHVRAPKDGYFQGSDLLELILENELRYGEMDIFHRHADEEGEGPVLFSMANMVKPGVFDLHSFEEFSTVGLSFFLTLPSAGGDNMSAFDLMLQTARNIASVLSGELLDEQRSALTGQTIQHYRERVRDFSRKQQLEKNKP